MATNSPVISKNLSPQDLLTIRKKGLISKLYVENSPGTNSRPASVGTIVLVSRQVVITPAVGSTWDNSIQLGIGPCCSS